jgi:serine/threonine-protein kinase
MLTERLAESPDALTHFDREARITSLLQHPNVVQVIDHNTAPDGTEYLVMEYLAGESLSERLSREGRLPLDTVVGIIEQIAAGLAAAHARGIVHRDLKPDNVVLVPVEGRQAELCKIFDFGISKRRGSLEMPGLLCGTPQYMAPEQVEGRMADVDGSTDQFALAVIAHELLTGRNPFLGDTVQATFLRVSSPSPPSAGFGREVDAVLARGLAKSNQQRFRSVTEFSEAFRAAALARRRNVERRASVPATDNGARDLERKARLRRRNWGVALGATVATTLAMSLVAGGSPSRLVAGGRARSAAVVSKAKDILPSMAAPRREEQPVPAARPPVVEEIDDAPYTVPAATRHSRQRGVTSRPATSRPRPAFIDEDATMPLSDTSGHGPKH